MKRHKWHAEHWVAFAGSAMTGLAALATGVGAYFVVVQIRDAREALHSSNVYLADKDILEAFDGIQKAQQELVVTAKSSDDSGPRQTLGNVRREVIRFDSVFGAIDDLNTTGGFGVENWKRLLITYCPALKRSSFRLADTEAPSAKSICERDASLWEDKR